mmetsp:Transcript_29673/g.53765  ORF Transcript_29673/g.53765 Transcript_29673/m.53765 type:complete len:231 (+) Transcript_29673:1331-2023(+)
MGRPAAPICALMLGMSQPDAGTGAWLMAAMMSFSCKPKLWACPIVRRIATTCLGPNPRPAPAPKPAPPLPPGPKSAATKGSLPSSTLRSMPMGPSPNVTCTERNGATKLVVDSTRTGPWPPGGGGAGGGADDDDGGGGGGGGGAESAAGGGAGCKGEEVSKVGGGGGRGGGCLYYGSPAVGQGKFRCLGALRSRVLVGHKRVLEESHEPVADEPRHHIRVQPVQQAGRRR